MRKFSPKITVSDLERSIFFLKIHPAHFLDSIFIQNLAHRGAGKHTDERNVGFDHESSAEAGLQPLLQPAIAGNVAGLG